jgi:hypothetical protein
VPDLQHIRRARAGALVRERAPAAQGADKLLHVAREAIAGRAEAHAITLLDEAIRIEQSLQDRQACGLRRVAIEPRDERLVARETPHAQRTKALGEWPRFRRLRRVPGRGDDTQCSAARRDFLCVFALDRRHVEGERARGKLAISQQRAQHPRIHGQLFLVAKVSRHAVHPEAILVALPAQHLDELCSLQDARRLPLAEVHAPEVLRARLGAAAIGEDHAIRLAHTLREDAGDDRRRAIDRGQRISHLQRPHVAPPRGRLDLCVQRL